MSYYRSYFLKNNTLISNNQTNNSQNPVTEISYGTLDKVISRFIFDVDFTELHNRINDGTINPNRIVKHVLHTTNTISYAQQYLGKTSYSSMIQRASSFNLDIFNSLASRNFIFIFFYFLRRIKRIVFFRVHLTNTNLFVF